MISSRLRHEQFDGPIFHHAFALTIWKWPGQAGGYCAFIKNDQTSVIMFILTMRDMLLGLKLLASWNTEHGDSIQIAHSLRRNLSSAKEEKKLRKRQNKIGQLNYPLLSFSTILRTSRACKAFLIMLPAAGVWWDGLEPRFLELPWMVCKAPTPRPGFR